MDSKKFLIAASQFRVNHEYLHSYKKTMEYLKLDQTADGGVYCVVKAHKELAERLDYLESSEVSGRDFVFLVGEISGLVTFLWYGVGIIRRLHDAENEKVAVLETHINELHGLSEMIKL